MELNPEEKLTLRKAVELLGIPADVSRRTATITCPVLNCAKHPSERKMNLNFDKYGPDEGAFRCPKCGTGGGPLQLWALYRGFCLDDTTASAADYFRYINGSKADNRIVRKKYVAPKRIDVDTADVDTRHRTFTAFLNLLTLSPSHREDLLRRGLTDDLIQKNGYKSNPMLNIKDYCQNLLNNGYVLEGVPGFYKESDGSWSFLRYSSGYLIPQRDGFGRIQGMQIRLENPPAYGQRYYTVSTAERFEKGAKGLSVCHFARGRNIDDVIITEGPLKADIISHFTGCSVIGMPGVNSQHYLKRALFDLKKAGMKKVTIAFDMDLYSNEHVMAALNKLKDLLAEMKIPYTFLSWDREYKGLDDWLLAKHTKEV